MEEGPMRRSIFAAMAALFLTMVGTGHANADAKKDQYVNIGTAGIAGVYYPTGGFLCNMLNKSRQQYHTNIRCTVESSGGSAANLRAMAAGDMSVALAQSDNVRDAQEGARTFQGAKPFKDLRFVMSIYPEAMQIVTRPDTGIKSFADLKGRKVNTANPGSGTQTTLYFVLDKAYHTTASKYFGQETKLTAREFVKGLCDKDYDAYIYLTGLGSATVIEAASTCGGHLVPWQDDALNKFLSENKQYRPVLVPKGTYSDQQADVPTWGEITDLVATKDVPDDVIYYLVKSVFDHFEDFKKLHPAYSSMTREASATLGQVVPYHPGALKFYREVGLIK
jgi:TRAP transporter TAXI family solute receptor